MIQLQELEIIKCDGWIDTHTELKVEIVFRFTCNHTQDNSISEKLWHQQHSMDYLFDVELGEHQVPQP